MFEIKKKCVKGLESVRAHKQCNFEQNIQSLSTSFEKLKRSLTLLFNQCTCTRTSAVCATPRSQTPVKQREEYRFWDVERPT